MSLDRSKRIRERPRISSAKLGEYLSSPRAARRERILQDQKFVPDFKVSRYVDAEYAIRIALLDGDVERRVLESARSLAAKTSRSAFRHESKLNCIEALNAFARAWSTIGIRDIAASTTGQPGFSLTIEGVAVSARPLALLHRQRRDGSFERGALQVVLRKEAALDRRGGDAVAHVLMQALIAANHQGVSAKLCVVLDVFSGAVFYAPMRQQRLDHEIRSACREIFVRWPAIAA